VTLINERLSRQPTGLSIYLVVTESHNRVLGNLYNAVLDRPEEAAAFHRQAADRHVEIGDRAGEGRARNNLAITLRRLGRLDEARRELRRAIECKAEFGHAAEPWKTWNILADIETDAGQPAAAASARAKALGAYLAYRRDGGENHWSSGRLALAVGQALLAGDPAAAEALLDQAAPEPPAAAGDPPQGAAAEHPYLAALRALCQGRRDPALAEAAGLDYDQTAELQLLLERLPNPGRRGGAHPKPAPKPGLGQRLRRLLGG
jgi:hypothetical protein